MSNKKSLFSYLSSTGTTIGFLEFSRNKDLGKKVKKFVALAPVVTVKHIEGGFKYLAKLSGPIKVICI